MPTGPVPAPRLTLALRPAGLHDAPAIARVWRRAWASANPQVAEVAPLAHWEARVRGEFGLPCVAQVVEHKGQIAAFLVLDAEQAYLCQLFVDPRQQGKGWGAAMLAWVCAACPKGWSLHVAEANEGARRFYERHGLRPGLTDRHPVTGRSRVRYCWEPASAASTSPASFSGASWGA